jgi:hypothetical protein
MYIIYKNIVKIKFSVISIKKYYEHWSVKF